MAVIYLRTPTKQNQKIMKNLCLMKLQGFLVLFCSLPFHSCETGESEDVLQESNSVSEKKFTNGY